MRRGWLSLLVALAGGVVHADEAPEPRYDAEAETAWARATWPDDLKGLHFHVPLAKLLAWAPRKGLSPAYLYTNDFDCRRVELARVAPGDSEDAPPELVGKMSDPARIEDGRPIREVRLIEIGLTLSRENGTTYVERRDARGTWQAAGGGGIWLEPVSYGGLSYVDDRVVRFDGNAQAIHAYCDGPIDWLACPGGGEHPCDRCDRVALMVIEARANGWSVANNYGGRAIACHDRCPSHPVSANLARIEALNAHTDIWRQQESPLATIPSLYKSRDDCLREHPHRSLAATRGRN
jgi:hypothetical protein